MLSHPIFDIFHAYCLDSLLLTQILVSDSRDLNPSGQVISSLSLDFFFSLKNGYISCLLKRVIRVG